MSSTERDLLRRAHIISQEILTRELVANDNSLWRNAYRYFIDALERQALNKKNTQSALSYFFELEPIKESFEKLTNELLAELDPLEAVIVTPPPHLDDTELDAIISADVADEFGPVDERILTCEERNLRRMDSLARLLTLRDSASACTAVTLHNGQLMVALNVEKNGTQSELFRIIALKIKSIREHAVDFLKTPNPSELDERAERLYLELLAHQPSRLDKDGLIQAAYKILHAMVFDEETFNPIEKAALLSAHFTLLAPHQDGLSTSLLTRTEESDSLIPLPQIKPGSAIRALHAEQLLAVLIYDLGKSPTHSMFGVSKLCCATCFAGLMTYRDAAGAALISVRGSHRQSYQGVVHLPTGDASRDNSLRRAVTHAKPSPGDTPDRPPLRPLPLGAGAATVGRRLFMEGSEVDVENRTGVGASVSAGAGDTSTKGPYGLREMPFLWKSRPPHPSFLHPDHPLLGTGDPSFTGSGSWFGPASGK
jgi:hypothetical protein